MQLPGLRGRRVSHCHIGAADAVDECQWIGRHGVVVLRTADDARALARVAASDTRTLSRLTDMICLMVRAHRPHWALHPRQP